MDTIKDTLSLDLTAQLKLFLATLILLFVAKEILQLPEKKTGKVSADKTRFQNIYGSKQALGEESKQSANAVDELGNSISGQKSGDTVKDLQSGSGSLKVNITPDPIEVLKAVEQIHANDIITVNGEPYSLKKMVIGTQR